MKSEHVKHNLDSVSSKIQYHLDEMAVANAHTLRQHNLPDFSDQDKRILDVGCGIGQTLLASKLPSAHSLVGVDIDLEALRYGGQKYSNIDYANCGAEALPFANDSFDLVYSRVALPYTNIPLALAEMHRVLKPGGRVWLSLHPLQRTKEQFFASIKKHHYRDTLFRLFVFFNGLSFHLAGKVFPFPANSRYESFQTRSAMLKACRKVGFRLVSTQTGDHFVCRAIKPSKDAERSSETQ